MVRIPITDNPRQNQDANDPDVTANTSHVSNATAAPAQPQSAATGGPSSGGSGPAATVPNNAAADPQRVTRSPEGTDPGFSTIPQSDNLESEIGPRRGEVAGSSGANVAGGERTQEQDAGAAMDEVMEQRTGEVDMWEQQERGQVDTQTKDLKPSPAQHEEGLGPSPTGSENTGNAGNDPHGSGASAATSGGDKSSGTASSGASSQDSSSAPDNATVTRAATEADERFLRLAADFENYKRQVARREAELRERTVRSVVEDLLPVLDNFERAVDAAKNARDVESLRVGVEYILQQFREALRGHGVEPIQAEGQSFDPLHHEAVEEVPGTRQPAGTIVGEALRGYSFKGQVLRPSRVRVAAG